MRTVITDSIKSVNRILRRKNNAGESTFGIEAVTALGLAWQIVIEKASSGGLVPIRLINNNTAAAIVLECIFEDKGILPFIPEDSICLATAREILNNMNLLRCNAYKASANVTVQQLEHFIEKYEKTLKDRNLYDGPMVLKEAIDALHNGDVKQPETGIETCYYRTPSMLETKFVDSLGAHTQFSKPEPEKTDYRFVKAYGIVNEADYVAKTIAENNIPFGDADVICDTAVYAPFIEEAFAKRGIHFNFTSGISASCFNLIRLLKDLIHWYTSRCSYKELFPVVHNPLYAITIDGKEQRGSYPYLKGISYGIGWDADRYFYVEQSEYDKSHAVAEEEICRKFREEELRALGQLAKDLDKAGTAVEAFDLLVTYAKSHTRKRNQENRFTTNAIQLLRKSMATINLKFSDKTELLEYLSNELDSLTYSSSETGNAVSISDIYNPMCLERENVFVLGLSAKEFKISTAESPVMGDELREELFGNPPCGNVTLAKNAIDEAEMLIRETLDSAPEGASITLLSSSSDVMRDCSDVSVSSLFEKLRVEKNAEAEEETGYYEITTHKAAIKHDDAWNGYTVSWPDSTDIIEKQFSKTTLDNFLKCPLMYHYDNELHINKEEYCDYDPGVWLAANSRGTMIHSILENYANAVLKDKKTVNEVFDRNSIEFKEAVRKAVSEAEKTNAAPNREVKEKECAECEEVVACYLTFLHKELHNTGWMVVGCEEKMDKEKSAFEFTVNGKNFKLLFSGTIDRIDRKENPDGSFSYRIIDYKTGKGQTADTMLNDTKQHFIYANYVMKKYGGRVEAFNYLFLNELLKGDDWNAEITEDKLNNDIVSPEAKGKETQAEQVKFYKAFVEHDYKEIESKSCEYCRFTDICLKGMAMK